MAELTIKFAGKNQKVGSVKLDKWHRGMPRNIRRAMKYAGVELKRQIVDNLNKYKGPRKQGKNIFGAEPPTSREFPAHRSGDLARSVTFQLRDGGMGVEIGPNMEYAAAQEKGSSAGNIPARPYIIPAWEKREKKIIRSVQKIINRPLKI